MKAYSTARARFCEAKAALKSATSRYELALTKITSNPARVHFDDKGDRSKNIYRIELKDLPSKDDLITLMETFQKTHAAMSEAWQALDAEDKASMNRPEEASFK